MIQRKKLAEKIKTIEEMLLKIYAITVRGVEAIKRLPDEEAFTVIRRSEEESDVVNWEIFEEAIATVATQQPAAKDLRFIVMATTIAAIHERINDLALDIAKAIRKIGGVPDDFVKSIETAVNTILEMLGITRDAMMAHSFVGIHDKLSKLDDIIDETFSNAINALEHRPGIPIATVTNMVMVLRDLERIGDLVGKIGTRLIYIETGKMVPIK